MPISLEASVERSVKAGFCGRNGTKPSSQTGRKSLEEVEEMFRKGGPRPWQTKLGESHLDERMAILEAEQRKASLEHNEKVQFVREDGTIATVDKKGT